MISGAFVSNLAEISILGGIFVVTLVTLLVYRRYHLKKRAG